MFSKVVEYVSRKFILALAALIGSFALAWTEKDMGGWGGSIALILTAYFGVNLGQDYVMKDKKPAAEVQVGEE